ncbi:MULTISPECIES: LysR substrate-binding domain-containing protein [unclassified Curtobacterium]|uniref:LysR substrate-binding domain-containing protein n=1 Tax=unclassified Curtobacterium TaxID=257496 RepID=UPI0008DE09F2|nr:MULTISPECIES: LysR substrate-binding domain-containing protein [unclassified Curtobacterium]OIH99593.1 LysR family transcriptional regulator [Curtobacterium sp. MCBA15_003]OII30572.1 LysR family transcriptional regulator [Curtobacterium sp. MMLR14_006]
MPAEQLDLNLLRVFDALLDAGSVSGAAEVLHLSVPATSRALGRLRLAMGDPVLVRAGRGMTPTPFALRAAARVKALLDDADRLRLETLGDPATWRRTFTIRINDALTPVLAPRLTRLVAAEAPHIQLRFVAQDSKDADLLRNGTLDLDVGVRVPSPPDIRSSVLFTDVFVAVVSTGSDLGRKPVLTLEDLCSVPHVSASRRGLDRGPLDDALEREGYQRRVAAIVPSYAVGALMALEHDVICLLPSRLAAHLQDRGVPIRAYRVPATLPDATAEQRWHQRNHSDPASQWLRGLMTAAASDHPAPH